MGLKALFFVCIRYNFHLFISLRLSVLPDYVFHLYMKLYTLQGFLSCIDEIVDSLKLK